LRTAELTEERWTKLPHVKSAFFAARQFQKCSKKGAGVIVTVTSIAGRNGGAPGSISLFGGEGDQTMTKAAWRKNLPPGNRVNGACRPA